MTEALLTTGEVAALLRVSEEFVREHAAELGAIRIGGGTRAPLRFEPASIDAWKDRARVVAPSAGRPEPVRPRTVRRKVPDGIDLLPRPPKSFLTGSV